MAETTLPPATERFAAHVGADAAERPAPSLARALGGFGALLVGAAVAALGVDVVLDGGSRVGVALMFVPYAGAGLALLVFGAPSQRTAGVTAVAVAVPAVLGFAILERGGYASSDVTGVLAASTVAWGLLHVAGPARGHGILLGAALVGAWATVASGLDVLALLDPVGPAATPDVTAPAAACLAFGVVDLAAARVLDHGGLRGTATGFLAAGVGALGGGVALTTVGGSDLLVGALMVGAGSAIGWVGSRGARRLSTWTGAAAFVGGLGVLASASFTGDDLTAPALAALGAGVAVVALTPALGRRLAKPGTTPES